VALAVTVAGCGSHRPRPAALRLERTDLVLLSRALERLEIPIRSELTAARAVWPALNPGLPQGPVPAATQQGIATAGARAQAVTLPPFVTKPNILTGPAAAIGALLDDYTLLAQRGWKLTGAAASPSTRPTDASLRFLRTNAGLYIYCIYDAHFDLSLIGKQLQHAYHTLGGPPALAHSLTQPQLEALARVYSPPSVRLEPHPPSSLGAQLTG
jgi:hypothetical protein